jgi:hypothetical protein
MMMTIAGVLEGAGASPIVRPLDIQDFANAFSCYQLKTVGGVTNTTRGYRFPDGAERDFTEAELVAETAVNTWRTELASDSVVLVTKLYQQGSMATQTWLTEGIDAYQDAPANMPVLMDATGTMMKDQNGYIAPRASVANERFLIFPKTVGRTLNSSTQATTINGSVRELSHFAIVTYLSVLNAAPQTIVSENSTSLTYWTMSKEAGTFQGWLRLGGRRNSVQWSDVNAFYRNTPQTTTGSSFQTQLLQGIYADDGTTKTAIRKFKGDVDGLQNGQGQAANLTSNYGSLFSITRPPRSEYCDAHLTVYLAHDAVVGDRTAIRNSLVQMFSSNI